jgi:cation transporter-like permease
MNKIVKLLIALAYSAFCFLAFVAFNSKSTDLLLEGMLRESEFYRKAQNGLIILMIYLIITPLQMFVMYTFVKKNKFDVLKKITLLFLIFSILFSLFAYYLAGVFPFMIPLIIP